MAAIAAVRQPSPRPQAPELPTGTAAFATGSTARPGATSSSPFPISGFCCSFVAALLHHCCDQLSAQSTIAQPAVTSAELALCHLRQLSADLPRTTFYLARLSQLASRCRRSATFFCLLIGYPMALGIARAAGAWRNILLLLVILPFWTSFLLRVYAWIGLIGNNSWFNRRLTSIVNTFFPSGSNSIQIPMMNTEFRGHSRHRLFLPAVHDPAALRQSRKTRPHAQ